MWDGRDRHQSRLLLQHVEGGVGGHEHARLRPHRQYRLDQRPGAASTARSTMPPPSRASTASTKAAGPGRRIEGDHPSTPSRRVTPRPTWSRAVPANVLEKIVAKISGRPARQGRGESPRGRDVPDRRRCGLHHRLDPVDQRRPAHVLSRTAAWSSGPRASRSLMILSARDARGSG